MTIPKTPRRGKKPVKRAPSKKKPAPSLVAANLWKPATKGAEELGVLELPSGTVSVCDAGTLLRPVHVKLPAGKYQARVVFDGVHDNLSMALVKKGATPIAWKNVGSYGVDAGMAGFFDGKLYKKLDKHQFPDDGNMYDSLIANHLDPAETKGHAGAFVPFLDSKFCACRSGQGDGVYATFVGKDKNGIVVAVVTTF